ncbi:MAG: DHHA1 domain-containing protein [Thaumarchaeota archaeon]|nr:DHHA1 domain-containing protein [Nitrososphaerota archaeon]
MVNHCISHVKDADGLCSAALTIAARGGTFRLTDYDQLIDELDGIPKDATELVLCDLGTDPSRFEEFRNKMEELTRRLKVTYIDHHYLSAEMKGELERLGIHLVHDVDECSSMLTYSTFNRLLPAESSYLAIFGAVTDYMDSSPLAGKMMERFDRQFVLLESTLLSYAISNQAREIRYIEMLVESLSRMEMPHTIEGVSTFALRQAETVRKLAGEVGRKGSTLGKLAYMETEQSSTGNVAKLLLGAFNVQVGVSYRARSDGRVEMSLRCTSECKVHLGQTISEIAGRHGGNGGGHAKAAGASIPAQELLPVLREFEARL